MGLLDQLFGRTQTPAPSSYGFRSYVQVVDGDAAYDTQAEVLALITGVAHAAYIKIWEMTVPAQQRIAWGFGSAGLPHNQGYMWFASLDIATDWDKGVLRIQQATARETRVIVVAEIPDSALHTTTVTTLATATPLDRNQMIALPEKVEYPLVREDSKLQLTYRLITAATAHDNVGFAIPITIYQ
ncbi:MAG: hypothetical protein A2Z29_04750 [Chloroflexi bacterium RBG_16_56_11]|nr:MAG: hypothetical protein A2Z29_04750 [Chloroflexi bacterium RBG_16_56_11]